MKENRCAVAKKRKLLIFGIFSACFTFVAWPAQSLEVAIIVCAAMSFRDDMVDSFSRARPAIVQTFLADIPVSLKYADTNGIPLTAVATLVTALSSLVLLPAFITVRLAIARTVCCSLGASALATSTRYSGWHTDSSNTKATSKCQWLTTERIFLMCVRCA